MRSRRIRDILISLRRSLTFVLTYLLTQSISTHSRHGHRVRHVWQAATVARDQVVVDPRPAPPVPHPSHPTPAQRSPRWRSASRAPRLVPTRRRRCAKSGAVESSRSPVDRTSPESTRSPCTSLAPHATETQTDRPPGYSFPTTAVFHNLFLTRYPKSHPRARIDNIFIANGIEKGKNEYKQSPLQISFWAKSRTKGPQ